MDLETGKRRTKPSSLVSLKLYRGGMYSVKDCPFCGDQRVHPAIELVMRRVNIQVFQSWF